MPKQTKLKDIADALGVSVATVSRALNDKADIGIETKRKIISKANELDYRFRRGPSSIQNIKAVNVIGVVVPKITHYFFSSVLQGIMNQAHANNYLVLVGESQHISKKEQKILEEFIDYGVSGILLAPCVGSSFEKNVLPIIHTRIPVVIMDRMYDNYHGNYVLVNDKRGAISAVTHLAKNGYKKIAYIGSTDIRSIGYDRKVGYIAALKQNNMEVREDYIVLKEVKDAEQAIIQGRSGAKELLSLEDPPDAIFAVTDEVAVGVFEYANNIGLKIPKDLGVAGFSNSQISKYLSPKLTTVHQNAAQMGKLSFDYFLNSLANPGKIFQKIFECELLIRESSRRVKN